MMEGWKVAVLGATDSMGEALLNILQQREFPVGELFLLTDGEDEGKRIRFAGKSVLVQKVEDFDWSQAQLAFFVAGWESSVRYAEQVADAGCVVIDSSDIFALEPDVPLVVPGVNSSILAEYRNRNIVTVANSLVSQLLTVVYPLIQLAGLSRLHVTNLLSVSANGQRCVEELAGQAARLLNGQALEHHYLSQQLAFNLIPISVDEKGSVPEERHMVNQIRKILQDPQFPVVTSFVQVPVFYGHTQLIQLETIDPLSISAVVSELELYPDILIKDGVQVPTPKEDVNDNIVVTVGGFRHDYGVSDVFQFSTVADNIKFGGALMAVQVAELLVQELLDQ